MDLVVPSFRCVPYLGPIKLSIVTVIAELNNVSVKQNNQVILSDINLAIGLYEQWAIIGKSGSGKTTLAHALMGSVFFTGNIDFHLPAASSHHRMSRPR